MSVCRPNIQYLYYSLSLVLMPKPNHQLQKFVYSVVLSCFIYKLLWNKTLRYAILVNKLFTISVYAYTKVSLHKYIVQCKYFRHRIPVKKISQYLINA